MWRNKLVLLLFALAGLFVATSGADCTNNPDCEFFCFGGGD